MLLYIFLIQTVVLCPRSKLFSWSGMLHRYG